MPRDDVYAWVIFIVGIVFFALGVGEVLDFKLVSGAVEIEGPAWELSLCCYPSCGFCATCLAGSGDSSVTRSLLDT